MEPCISVILPIYNVEKYIDKCLDSILNQTFTNFEVIVVDDCSTDNTMEIVDSYIEKFKEKNISLIISKTEKNSGGPGIPRNIGLSLSKGTFIYHIDGDDYINNVTLEVLYNTAQQYDADLVYMAYYYEIKSNGIVKKGNSVYGGQRKEDLEIYVLDSDTILKRFLLLGFAPMVWKQLVRRDLLINNNIITKDIFCQDFIWTLEVFANLKKFVSIPVGYYYHTANPDSISNNFISNTKHIEKWTSSLLATYKILSELKTTIPILKNSIYFSAAINRRYQKFMNRMRAYNIDTTSKEFYKILRDYLNSNEENQEVLFSFFFNLLSIQNKIVSDVKRSDKL